MPRPLSPANRISQRWRTWLLLPLLGCAGLASCEAFTSATLSDAGPGPDAALVDSQTGDTKLVEADGALVDSGPARNLVGTEGICVSNDVNNDCPSQVWAQNPSDYPLYAEPISIGSHANFIAVTYGYRGNPSQDGRFGVFDGQRIFPPESVATAVRTYARSAFHRSQGFSASWDDTFRGGGIASLEPTTQGDAGSRDGSTDAGLEVRLNQDFYSTSYLFEQQPTQDGKLLVRSGTTGKVVTTLAASGVIAATTVADSDLGAGRRVQGFFDKNNTKDNLYIAYSTYVERRLNNTSGVESLRRLYDAPPWYFIGDILIRERNLYFTVLKGREICENSAQIIRMKLDESGLPAFASTDGGDAGPGRAFEVLAKDVRCPAQLAADADFLYWTEFAGKDENAEGGTLRRISIEDAQPGARTITTLQKKRNKPEKLIAAATGLYWLEFDVQKNRSVVLRIPSK
jgi:hypothetical protein